MWPRKARTTSGDIVSRSVQYKDGKVALKPGVHYTLIEPEDEDDYVAFPEEPESIYGTFRHAWVLVRKQRPDVVVIEGFRTSKASRSPTENAKYCCLFFRPWILLTGDPVVPNFTLLGLAKEQLVEVYNGALVSPKKKAHSATVQGDKVQHHVAWARSWDEYARGGVVSESAAMLIRSFFHKTIAVSGAQQEDTNSSEEDNNNEDPDIPPVKVSAHAFAHILNAFVDKPDNEDGAGTAASTAAKLKKKQRNGMFLQEIN